MSKKRKDKHRTEIMREGGNVVRLEMKRGKMGKKKKRRYKKERKEKIRNRKRSVKRTRDEMR